MDKLIAVLTNHDDDIYCFRKELIESLNDDGYRILISCPYGEKLELMRDMDFEFIDTPIDRRGTNVFRDLKLMIRYFRMLKKHRPDIILSYTAKPNVYGSIAASYLKIPYLNNVTGFGSVISKKGLISKLIMLLFKKAFKKSECVFFQNSENMELAEKLSLVRGRHKLIPGSGVNTERFSLMPYPKDEPKIVFNYIGRVLKEKGIDDYISAAKIIKSRYPNTEFNIIGFIESTDKHYEKEFKVLQSQGIIIYHGSQKDIRPYILRSHCTIHPSKYGEGMSNVLLESAASGRPVITTNIAGCREIVDNMDSGFIYEPGNVNELVMRIEEFLRFDNDRKKGMGEAGREKVRKSFSRQIVIDSYKKEIQSILSSSLYRSGRRNESIICDR